MLLKTIIQKSILFPLALLLLSLGVVPYTSIRLANAQPETTELIVRFKQNAPSKIVNSLLASASNKSVKLKAAALKVPKNLKDQVVKVLSDNPLVEYAEPNHQAKAFFTPNDSSFSSRQWGLENTGKKIDGVVGKVDADIDASRAWDFTRGTGSQGPITIAILDTGIDQEHKDLSSKVVLQKNFTNSPTPDDLYGHGTHVAGIAAAITNNSTGVAGGCPDCVLINAKVLNDKGSGDYLTVSNGIIWAADNGAKVINLSLGGSSPSSTLESAVNYAWSKGSVVVAAAGNCGCGTKSYPAAYKNTIAVAATNNKDKKAYFSSYGYKWVDVAAPGEDIYSTLPNDLTGGRYGYLSGTSMSTPLTSATAALIWSSPYGTSALSVRSRLQSTSQKLSGTSTYWSAGRINARAAVAN